MAGMYERILAEARAEEAGKREAAYEQSHPGGPEKDTADYAGVVQYGTAVKPLEESCPVCKEPAGSPCKRFGQVLKFEAHTERVNRYIHRENELEEKRKREPKVAEEPAEWLLREIAKEVQCPHCAAQPGSPCKRPSGHTVFGGDFHAGRKARAKERELKRRAEQQG